MVTPEKGRPWLYLFSSNQTPLYAQDILDVLAAPRGTRYTFRYDQKYVEEETLSDWKRLSGKPVLVLFSIQQRAKYHDPAFLPIRRGVVANTRTIGTRAFVDFDLADIVSLPVPVPDPGTGKDTHDEYVRLFTQRVTENAHKVPYEKSASLGAALPATNGVWDAGGDQEVLFERTAEYLSRTDSFRHARFLRFLELKRTGAEDAEAIELAGEDPAFELTAGTTYDLRLLHAQRDEPESPESFAVVADGTAVGIVGRAGFDIASRYDRITLRLHATPTTGLEDRETVLAIGPSGTVQGPGLSLRMRIKPNRKRAIGVAAGQTIALITVALATLFSAAPARVGLAVVGAVVAAGLQLVPSVPLRAPWMPTPATPPQHAPSADREPPANGTRAVGGVR